MEKFIKTVGVRKMFAKLLIKLISLLRNFIPLNSVLNHKYINKNQVTNLNVVINALKNRGFNPDNIFDIGCFRGLWSKQVLKIYKNSNYYLYDANIENEFFLNDLKKNYQNITYKIKLFSDDIKDYNFYKMQSGSSIFQENTSHAREKITLKSSLLSDEITSKIKKTYSNLLKIDTQGSEIKILKGLGEFIKNFEVIILEVSVHEYNKNSPMFDEVISFLKNKDYIMYDIYDLKRLGDTNSFLIQFDSIFVRKNSKLLDVKI